MAKDLRSFLEQLRSRPGELVEIERSVRPHDFDLMLEPNGTTEEAMIERVVHLGFEVRVEFTLPNGEHAWAQVTREDAEQLELQQGQIVYVRPGRSQVFGPGDLPDSGAR